MMAVKNREKTSSPNQDHGYAWLVAFASFISQFDQCGVFYSMGMLYIVFKENMEGGSSAVAMISSINTASAFFSAPLAGILVSKLGCRIVGICGALLTALGLILSSQATNTTHLYISYGFITGLGLALQYNPCLSILPVHFDKWLGLASGIATSGCGVGSIVFPILIKYLADLYGWRGALIVCAGIQLHSIVCAALYRPAPCKSLQIQIENSESHIPQDIENDLEKNEYEKHQGLLENEVKVSSKGHLKADHMDKDISHTGDKTRDTVLTKLKRSIRTQFRICSSLFRCRSCTLFCFSQLFYMTSVSIIYTHIGAFAMSLGFTEDHAAMLFFIIGITSAIMRFLTGLATQIPGCTPLRLCMVSITLLGILTGMFSFYTTMPLLLTYGGLFGTLLSPYNTLPVFVVKEMFSTEMVSTALGFQLVFLAPGCLAGPPIAGFIYDKTGIYLSSFYMASILMLMAGILNAASLLFDFFQRVKKNDS